jgi:8-oxo-dGTP pyrophosphatase MutT (NUDIX family)
MNFEPQKFFIGLVDFFTIVMPGAMLTYVIKDWGAANLFGLNFGVALDRAETVIVFLFFSYLLGHFVFLISAILDEWIYDPLRAWTDWGQITKRLVKRDPLSAHWKRKFATSNSMFGKNADNAVIQAQRIKARALSSLEAEDAINAFQWCKARLLLMNDPQAFVAVQRFEADSKFFRSFFVVLAALTLVYAYRGEQPATALCLIGMLLALWRYIDQRFKSTQQAYWLVISDEAESAKLAPAKPRQDGLTHAGAIVFRRKNGKTKFMLVTASNSRSEWVLPKGHIEPGEDPRVTAVRETKEETAHWARVVDWLDDLPLGNNEGAPIVRWFLLEACEKTAGWRPESRRRGWFSLGSAIRIARFPETKELLSRADAKIKSKRLAA